MALPEPPPLGTAMLPAGTFAGMVVMVTGGGTGLGKAIGVEFARLGAAVAVVSRDAAHGTAGVVGDGGGGRARGRGRGRRARSRVGGERVRRRSSRSSGPSLSW